MERPSHLAPRGLGILALATLVACGAPDGPCETDSERPTTGWALADGSAPEHRSRAQDGIVGVRLPARNTLTTLFELDRPTCLRIGSLRAGGSGTGGGSPGALTVEVDVEGRERLVATWDGSEPLALELAPAPAPRDGARHAVGRVRIAQDEPSNGAGDPVWVFDLRVLGEPIAGTRPERAAEASSLVVPERLPHVVLYVVDTLRADAVGDGELTPRLAALAAEARDLPAIAQSPWTRPSVASLLTGLWPSDHGVESGRAALPLDVAYLPALLAEASYRTIAVTTSDQSGAVFGFDRGFEEFHELFEESYYLEDSSRLAVERVLERIDATARSGASERPLFLFVHTIDPHGPYTPEPELRARFAAGVEERELDEALERRLRRQARRLGGDPDDPVWAPRLGSVPWLIGLERGWLPADDRMATDLRALYDAEVHEADRWVGKLVDGLKERDLWRDTLFWFTSDHGEEFAEHGGWQHGKTFYSEVLDVPLLVKPPRSVPADAIPPQPGGPIRHVDFLPTILHVAGLDPPPGVRGRSLFDGEPSPRRNVASVDDPHAVGSSLLDESWKLVVLTAPQPRTLLFDLDEDPGEQRNLAEERPLLTEYLARRLELARVGVLDVTEREGELDAETLERLRAMGYFAD